jgi:hypothetical protein
MHVQAMLPEQVQSKANDADQSQFPVQFLQPQSLTFGGGQRLTLAATPRKMNRGIGVTMVQGDEFIERETCEIVSTCRGRGSALKSYPTFIG